jgi:transcriptional regulator with XRE-family HTH domain
MGLFGKELVRLRTLQGWNPTQLAEKLDVTPAAVWQWEEGRTFPTRARIAALEEVFGLDAGSLKPLVEADRVARRRPPITYSSAPLETMVSPTTLASITRHRHTASSRPALPDITLDRFDDVDDLIFATSGQVRERVAMIIANNQRVEELHAEARELMDQALENFGGPDTPALLEKSQALVDLARKIIMESKALSLENEAERARTLRLIQQTRYVVNADTKSNEVAPEKITDVVKRRLARRASRRRSETLANYKRVEESTNKWFTPEASPSDAVPLLTLLLNLVNRVNDLEGTVTELRTTMETERVQRQGKAAMGSAPQEF